MSCIDIISIWQFTRSRNNRLCDVAKEKFQYLEYIEFIEIKGAAS